MISNGERQAPKSEGGRAGLRLGRLPGGAAARSSRPATSRPGSGAPVELVGVAVRRLDAPRDIEVPDGLLTTDATGARRPRRRRPGRRGDRRHRARPLADPGRARERQVASSPPTRRCSPRTARRSSRPPRRPAATSTTRPPSPARSRSCGRCASRSPATGSPGCSASSTAPPTSSSTRWTPPAPASPRRSRRPRSSGTPRPTRPPTSRASTPPPRPRSWPRSPSTPASPPPTCTARASPRSPPPTSRPPREMDSVVKLLAICELRETEDGQSAVAVRVHPAMIPRSHPLASVREAYNAVFVESEAAGQLMFYGPGAGGAPTASAVLGDLVTVARNRLADTRGRRRVGVRRPRGAADGGDRHPLPRRDRRRRPRRRARRGRDRVRRARRLDPDRPPGGSRRRRPARRRLATRRPTPSSPRPSRRCAAWTSSARSPR